MNLYLIRHGRTDSIQNDNLIQSPNTPLGEYGLSQAKRLANKLKLVKISHIYSSDYARAFQTATQISQTTSIGVTIHPDVHEKVKHQALNGALVDSDVNLRFMQENQENRYNFDWKFENQGESFHDLQKRVQKVIDFLLAKHADDSIAIVTHAFFIEMFLALILLGPDTNEHLLADFMHSLSISNASITSLKYDPTKKAWKLLTLNDYSHLEDDWLKSHNGIIG